MAELVKTGPQRTRPGARYLDMSGWAMPGDVGRFATGLTGQPLSARDRSMYLAPGQVQVR